jgi:hypothetical protein
MREPGLVLYKEQMVLCHTWVRGSGADKGGLLTQERAAFGARRHDIPGVLLVSDAGLSTPLRRRDRLAVIEGWQNEPNAHPAPYGQRGGLSDQSSGPQPW